MNLQMSISELREKFPNDVRELIGTYDKDSVTLYAHCYFADRRIHWSDVRVNLYLTEDLVKVYRCTTVNDKATTIWVITTDKETVTLPEIDIKTTKEYSVTYSGTYGYIPADTYEGYNNRLRMRDAGKLADGELVYDKPQALDHIRQLKRSGNYPPDTVFYIEITHSVITKIPVK